MHRLILGITCDSQGDHINGDGLDNRRANLRPVTHAQNMQNRRGNGPTFKGIYCVERTTRNPWMAKIAVAKKQIYLGYYATPEDAARAYDEAAKKYFGEFARLNFPEPT